MPGAARTPPHLATLVFISGSGAMAINIVLPVLPVMALDLATSDATIQLVVTLFLAMTGVAQLFVGPLSDRYGRRPVLLGTTVLFVIASTICWFAPSVEWLIFGRVLQAAVAASIALSRAILRDLYDRSKAASMIGYVTMAMAVMPMIAPTMGGFIGEMYGWRANFMLMDAVGVAMLIFIWLDLGETHEPHPVSRQQQIADYRALLREPQFWGFALCAMLASGAYFAFLGGAPFVGTHIIGMRPTQLGMYFAFVAVGYVSGNFISGRYSERIGIEPMMLLGCTAASFGVALALALMSAFEPHPAYLFMPMMLVGLGNGMTLPNAAAGALSVRPDLAGSASGVAGALQIGGGAALAQMSGALISVENGAMPLYIIMFLSSIGGAALAFAMYAKARRLGRAGAGV